MKSVMRQTCYKSKTALHLLMFNFRVFLGCGLVNTRLLNSPVL